MNASDYRAFTQALVDCLQGDLRVIGLVALGSMAGQDYQPDEWSDHDFFVVTLPGEQEAFREDPGWLPDAGQIVLHYRETAHGVKALYRSGHLLEFAVFDLAELGLARVNRYRILFDKGGVRRAVEKVVVDTLQATKRRPEDEGYQLGQFLTNLVVGAGRAARGEPLSGQFFIKAYAVGHLVRLLCHRVPVTGKNRLDNLDPLRRFEMAYPQLGQELQAILDRPAVDCAALLLELADRELRPRVGDAYPSEAVAAVRAFLRNVREHGEQAHPAWN
jgi:hypothetical protein